MKMKRITTTALLLFSALSYNSTACAQTADQDTTVVIPETGILAIHPSRNFTGQRGLIVCSCFDSKSSGLYFTKYVLEEVVMGSSANSNSALFLLGKPGTYTLTLTDAEVTGRINTTVDTVFVWQIRTNVCRAGIRVAIAFA